MVTREGEARRWRQPCACNWRGVGGGQRRKRARWCAQVILFRGCCDIPPYACGDIPPYACGMPAGYVMGEGESGGGGRLWKWS